MESEGTLSMMCSNACGMCMYMYMDRCMVREEADERRTWY